MTFDLPGDDVLPEQSDPVAVHDPRIPQCSFPLGVQGLERQEEQHLDSSPTAETVRPSADHRQRESRNQGSHNQLRMDQC